MFSELYPVDPEGHQWCGKREESCSSLQGISEKTRIFRLWHLKATVLAKAVPKQCSSAAGQSLQAGNTVGILWEYCSSGFREPGSGSFASLP